MNDTYFVRINNVLYKVSEGTGDNLTPEDIKAGIVDYIYYDEFNLNKEEITGGMVMLRESFKEKYKNVTDSLKEVLELEHPEADERTIEDMMERSLIYLCDDIKKLPEEAFEAREYEYHYGMRLRGCSIGTQPKEGFLYRKDSDDRRYYDIIAYNRELTRKEREEYSLEPVDELEFLIKDEIKTLYGKKDLSILWPDGQDSLMSAGFTIDDCLDAVRKGAKIHIA